MKKSVERHESKAPFYIILLYLFLEFGRPQNLVSGLGSLHLPAITIVLILISLLMSGKTNISESVTTVFLLILSEMLVHGPFAKNNYWAFWVFYGMVINFIAYLGISQFIDTEHKFDKFLDFYFVIFIYLSIFGLIYHGRGVGGFLGDENDFCMVLNMVFPLALYSVISAKSRSRKAYYIALSVLFLVANVTTLSRGGFLGLAAVIFYCTFRSKNKLAITSLAVLLMFFAVLFAPEEYWKEVRSIEGEGSNPFGTGAQRIYAWKLGWEMFLENPILGVGQGNYPWHVVDIENKLGVQWIERSLGGRAAHSLYFTLMPELGLVGLMLYGTLISNISRIYPRI
jgi:O-antigen ligase